MPQDLTQEVDTSILITVWIGNHGSEVHNQFRALLLYVKCIHSRWSSEGNIPRQTVPEDMELHLPHGFPSIPSFWRCVIQARSFPSFLCISTGHHSIPSPTGFTSAQTVKIWTSAIRPKDRVRSLFLSLHQEWVWICVGLNVWKETIHQVYQGNKEERTIWRLTKTKTTKKAKTMLCLDCTTFIGLLANLGNLVLGFVFSLNRQIFRSQTMLHFKLGFIHFGITAVNGFPLGCSKEVKSLHKGVDLIIPLKTTLDVL